MTRAFYPGAFDPVTNGHVDVVERASRIFEELVVGVYGDPPKRLMFDVHERVELFRQSVPQLTNVRIEPYRGLTVDMAKTLGAKVILRGLRIGSDFEYENQMALFNRAIDSDAETLCLFSAIEYQFVSSTRIKEIASLGGDVSSFVPAHVLEPLMNRLRGATGPQRA